MSTTKVTALMSSSSGSSQSKNHNSSRQAKMASPKRKRTPPLTVPLSDPSRATTDLGRNGLGPYIKSPETFPPSRVVYHNDKFVVIHDLFPKASVHLLLLPRDPAKVFLHPFEALAEEEFLKDVRREVDRLKVLAAGELRRRFSAFSQTEMAARKETPEGEEDENEQDEKMMEGEAPLQQQHKEPQGRDYSLDLLAGIHAHPSMAHLHIHILSRDRHSPCVRHRRHYNSFSTPFFVPIDAFPLKPDDPRRHPGRHGYIERDLQCWRCGAGFGRRFKALKEHLEEEFERWKTE